jgi:hypothetical protein
MQPYVLDMLAYVNTQSFLPRKISKLSAVLFHKQDTTLPKLRMSFTFKKMFLFPVEYLLFYAYKTRYRVEISPATDGHIPAAIQYPLPFAAQQSTRGQSHQHYISDIKYN